ncbi:hypothetical protein [Algicola sagamiensis]|uniref:hypothetical protein n=1 Tax=Algicola sagamiensis TaxID=163869 RepID=UPI0003A9037F|nr:hypothetical protein [Algicola sagamiensis]
MTTLESTQLEALAQLLFSLVDNDASVGFLTPLSKPMARQYWEGVLDTSRVLWVATCNEVNCGKIQLHLEPKQNGIHLIYYINLSIILKQEKFQAMRDQVMVN